jgi:hypothetical protein
MPRSLLAVVFLVIACACLAGCGIKREPLTLVAPGYSFVHDNQAAKEPIAAVEDAARE